MKGATALTRIPDSNRFAGRILERPLPGGTLWACWACDLHFRHPRIAESALDDLYRNGDTQVWNPVAAQRTDFRLVQRALERHLRRGNVLDVGCADGSFLAQLDERYARFGVEINEDAANGARLHGIDVLGSDLRQLAACRRHFDAVVAIDVLEHAYRPRKLAADCAALLAPGGLLLMTTGNARAWSWRMMGGAYWYCTNPEHVSFVTRRWVEILSRDLRLDIVQLSSFAHDRSAARFIAQASLNVAYRCSPRLLGRLRRSLARDRATRADPVLQLLPPSWSAAADHLLIVLRRKAA
jgi:2-polyprenyl-3-methyl-5-hydroxy-6-metoxy-1,4-benzoquinol methylase